MLLCSIVIQYYISLLGQLSGGTYTKCMDSSLTLFAMVSAYTSECEQSMDSVFAGNLLVYILTLYILRFNFFVLQPCPL